MSGFRGILILLVLIVGGPFLLWMGFEESRTMSALADHGKTADAVVEEITWKKKRGRESGYQAKVVFVTEANETVKESVSVSTSVGERLRAAPDTEPTILPIRYLPENPHSVRLTDHTDTSTPMFLGGAAMLLIGIGIVVFRLRKKAETVGTSAQPA